MATTQANYDGLPMRDFAHSLPMALLKARESVMVGFRRLLRQHELTEQQWRVLRALIETDGIEVTALADSCFVLMPSLSRILATLEKRGLIDRNTVSSDRRRATIAITGRGKKLFTKIAPEAEKHYAFIAESIGTRNLQQLYVLLDNVFSALTQQNDATVR